MDTKLTISVKTMLVAGLAVLALLSAYLLGGARGTGSLWRRARRTTATPAR